MEKDAASSGREARVAQWRSLVGGLSGNVVVTEGSVCFRREDA